MQFDSISAFFAMQGHGAFVWSAYAIALFVLLALVISPLRKNKQFFTQQAMRARRENTQSPTDTTT